MKYIKTLEAYKDFIGKGREHIISEIDDNYVLKTPNQYRDLDEFKKDILTMKNYPDIFPDVKILSNNRASVEKLNTKLCLEEIDFMCNYFAKCFLKECSTFDNIKNNIKIIDIVSVMAYVIDDAVYSPDVHFLRWIGYSQHDIPTKNEQDFLIKIRKIVDFIVKARRYFTYFLYAYDNFYEYITEISNENVTFEKWLYFIKEIQELPFNLDVHDDNFGLEKTGNIKLLDF